MKHPKLTYKRATQRNGKKGSYTNPLADCYDWADENFGHCGLGWVSKNKGYQDGFFNDRCLNRKMLRKIEFRKALENNESIQNFFPDHVSESEIKALFQRDKKMTHNIEKNYQRRA